jgi:mRNA interferase RelE/StbE
VGKPLRFEYEGRWSARRGPYRIISSLDQARRTVTVLAVGHRADVYRKR